MGTSKTRSQRSPSHYDEGCQDSRFPSIHDLRRAADADSHLDQSRKAANLPDPARDRPIPSSCSQVRPDALSNHLRYCP